MTVARVAIKNFERQGQKPWVEKLFKCSVKKLNREYRKKKKLPSDKPNRTTQSH